MSGHAEGVGVQPPGAQAGVAIGDQQGYYGQADFFLSNYRLGKTLGIGSFGKVATRQVTLLAGLAPVRLCMA